MVYEVFRHQPNNGDSDIYIELKKDFTQPKYESQSVVGLKEMMMIPSETPWDLD